MSSFRFILIFTMIGFFFLCHSAFAAKSYITDSFEVTLRTGPSLQNKIIAMLPSAKLVDVINSTERWSHVIVLDGKYKDMEGWVLSRYLISRVPWRAQAKYFKGENARIKEKFSLAEKERDEVTGNSRELSKQLKETTYALKKLQKEYKLLKKGSSNYLELIAKYDVAQSSLEVAENKVNKLTLENDRLKYSERNTWFIAGASVLFFGFMVGLFIGKRQKKQKSMFYS